jgi:hypothetical protein
MSDVQLIWPNKHLSLRASGSDSYEWVRPTDRRLRQPLKLETAGSRTLSSKANVLAIGDGLDVVEALKAQTSIFIEGIRLVYIDPPYNTNADVRQYSDTMERSMWLSMMRDRLMALRPILSENASVWVHLDDAEVHRARAVMDEIFGVRCIGSVAEKDEPRFTSGIFYESRYHSCVRPERAKEVEDVKKLIIEGYCTSNQQRRRSPRAMGRCPVYGPRLSKCAAIRNHHPDRPCSATAPRSIMVRY